MKGRATAAPLRKNPALSEGRHCPRSPVALGYPEGTSSGATMKATPWLIIAALSLSVPAPGHAVAYTITDLGVVGLNSGAYAINSASEIAGVTYPSGCCNGSATIWNGSVSTPLGALPGINGSLAQSINSSGQVAGYSFSATSQVATVWNGVTPTALPSLPGTNFGNAFAINHSGQMAGASYVSGAASPLATVWNGTTNGLAKGCRDEAAHGANRPPVPVAPDPMREWRDTEAIGRTMVFVPGKRNDPGSGKAGSNLGSCRLGPAR